MTLFGLSVTKSGTPKQYMPSDVKPQEAHGAISEKFSPEMFNLYTIKPLYVISVFRKHRRKKNKLHDTTEKLSDKSRKQGNLQNNGTSFINRSMGRKNKWLQRQKYHMQCADFA